MYFITSVYPKKDGYGTRCVGYLSNKEKAIDAVTNNACDIYEAGAYPYAIIECIEEGFYQYDFEPLWFKYNKESEQYDKLEKEPDFIGGKTVGFAIRLERKCFYEV